jgi:hypothetical protein
MSGRAFVGASFRVQRWSFEMGKKIGCGLLLVVGLSACGFTEAKEQGEALAEQYFAAAKQGETASILTMYDEAFYKATPRAQWSETYSRIRTKLGKPQTHTLSTWNVNSMSGTSDSGQYVTLAYQVQYEAGTGTETIAVFIPAATGKAGIHAHNFNSDALLR